MTRRFAPTVAAVLAVAALALTGCAGGGGGQVGEPEILRGNWVLAEASDAAGAIVLDGAKVTLGFNQATGGVAACNSYSATVVGGPGEVDISDVVQTEMACVPPDAMIVESRYLAAFAASTAAVYEGDELVLTGPHTELRFDAAPDTTSSPSEVPMDPDTPVTGCDGAKGDADPDYVCPQ